MKNWFSFGAWALILVPMLSSAELLIYKGNEGERFTGPNGAAQVQWNVIVIVDHDSGNYDWVGYAKINGFKRLSTTQHTNSHIVPITGANNKTYSLITRIPTDCDSAESPGKESVLLKGADSTLLFNTNQTTTFPRILNDYGLGLSHSTSSGLPYLTEGNELVVFNQTETFKSNNAGETLDAAFTRFTNTLQSAGYTP